MTYEDVVKWWQDKKLSTAADFENALDNFQIMFTCNSNNIEGDTLTYHTTREIFEEAPLTTSGLLPRQIFEVRNQKFAFKSLMKCLERKVPLSLELIKRIHYLMMYGSYDTRRWEKGERPGTFKIGEYCVGMTDEGTPAEYVAEDLTELIDEVNESDGDPIIVATYFHLKFESIHPFADGNGRVGRTLMNYYLMLNGYPPMVIYNEEKDTYYMGLEVFDRTEEIKGVVQFFKEQTVKTWSSRIQPDKKNLPFTKEQIALARSLAPNVYATLSDEALWELVGNYVLKITNDEE